MLKRRKAKKSTRGVYLQDKELRDTLFKPGVPFRTVVDIKHRKLIVLPSEEKERNTVSSREIKDGLKPVIDIRDRKTLSVFHGCDYLEVEIYQDQVVIHGFVEDEGLKQSPESVGIHQGVECNKEDRRKILYIGDYVPVRHQATLVLSQKALDEAVGFGSIGHAIPLSLPKGSGTVVDLHRTLPHLRIPLQVASLFSGIGALDYGFQNAGFELVFALEKDYAAAQSYRENLGDHIVCEDIQTFPLDNIPQAPVMIAGPPCQGFSNSNRVTHAIDNPNNLLASKYIEAIRANKNCQVFVWENVPQLLTMGKGYFKDMIFDALGDFQITSGVLRSADFGSPQLRSRAILIGSKIGKIPLPKPMVSSNSYMTVREAFKGITESLPNQLDITKPRPDTEEKIKWIPQGGNWRDLPDHLRPTKECQSIVFRRLAWDAPAPTIVNPRKSMILHPEENRILSVRECCRLFDLPDWYTVKGTLNQMQQTICNAVPAKMAKAIAITIKNAINKFNIHHRLKLV